MSKKTDITESLAAHLKLRDIAENRKVDMKLGNKTYKVHRLCNWTARKITVLLWESRLLIEEEKGVAINMKALVNNRKIVPRVLSYAILKYPWRIRLWHWYMWRMIDRRHTQAEYQEALLTVFGQATDLDFYLSNLTSLLQSAVGEMMMAKETILPIAAAQSSEQKTT